MARTDRVPDAFVRKQAEKGMPGSRFVVFFSAIGDRRHWPLVVGPARLFPASRTAGEDGETVHFTARPLKWKPRREFQQ